jgi:hypothetical protein
MKRRVRRCSGFLFLMLGFLLLVPGLYSAEPDEYRIIPGPQFQPLSPDHPSRPAWLFATARGMAQSADGAQDWIVYEWALNRTLPFHHLLMEILVADEISDLFIRLLDDQRQTVSDDFMGNIADRIAGSGTIYLDLPLADQPDVSIIQLLLPAGQEDALRHLSVIPASYEILMKTAGDFVRGAQAWIRTPIYDPKNLDLLADLTLLEDGRLGDMTSPISTFAAYGVEARPVHAIDSLPDIDEGIPTATIGFALDALPALARFNVTIRHVDPLAPVEVWVNQHRAGRLSLNLPDLEEPAYWPNEEPGTWSVGRWTRGWFFIDHDFLRRGDNTIRIGQRPAHSDTPPLEMVAPALQFKYPWEEIATYPLLRYRTESSPDLIVEGIDGAPWGTSQQEDDFFIIRADGAFRPIGPDTPTPDWLNEVKRERTSSRHRYTFRLHPDQTPHQLGLDIIYMRGRNARIQVDLLRGDEAIARDIFGELRLDSPYVQSTLPLQIPLHAYGADTIVLDLVDPNQQPPTLSRFSAQGRLAQRGPRQRPFRNRWLAHRSSLRTSKCPHSRRSHPARHAPPGVIRPRDAQASGCVTFLFRKQEPGTAWKPGVLTQETHFIGDSREVYFADWQVNLDQAPQLGRIDLLVQHLNVIEGLEVRINGNPAGHLSLHLPSLHDANYMLFRVNRLAEDGQSLTHAQRYAIDYGPFARASLVFDGRLLRPGNNTISIGKSPRLKGTNDHYAMKDIRLQLKFPWAKDLQR